MLARWAGRRIRLTGRGVVADNSEFQGRDFYQGLFDALVLGMGAAKGYLFDHGPRVAVQADTIAERAGLDADQRAEVFFAAVLADIGMIGLVEDEWEIPVRDLSKQARAEVHQHPARSAAAAATIPFLAEVRDLIRHHHEWWDGNGYPDGIEGEAIPVGARILRLADTVTALAEPRPHRPKYTDESVRSIIAESGGREFDPDLTDIWLALHDAGELPERVSLRYREIRERAVEQLVFRDRSTEPDGSVLLELLASLIDAKDPHTGGHSRRVARLAEAVADVLGLEEVERQHARAAGYLHDLGKLAVPSRVLRKPEALDETELNQVRRHAKDGAELLRDIPVLQQFSAACRFHHERWDGKGYPDGISGDRIPRDARILAVCDAYDAMTSARAYRPGKTHEAALAEVRDESGAQFGPAEAEAFLAIPPSVFDEVNEIRDEGPIVSERSPHRNPPNGVA